MANYWFVSVPTSGSKQNTWQNLKGKLKEAAEVTLYTVPEFKIGTLDALVLISDELAKYDASFESSANKLADMLRNVSKDPNAGIDKSLVINDRPVDQYIKTFEWNSMKYRTDKSLQEIADILNQEVISIDNFMKSKMTNYSQVKSTLQSMQRKDTGNLAVKNLAGLVKKEYFVLGSEYLTTLLVAVPKNSAKDWQSKYESLTQMVVPRSSQKIAEDDDYGLWTVTLFKRVADEFSNKCREEKFIVRDFEYDENILALQKKDLAEVAATEKEQQQALSRLAKTNFSEVFQAWMHLKVLRVFVESVLRYGLPPDFAAMCIMPRPKMEKKTKEVLNENFGSLGGARGRIDNRSNSYDALEAEYEHLFDKNYYPYVFFEIGWDPSKR
ncbi:hypothetical protein BZG36_04135 [Bifiguratus adelaidae]|uniref:V-type proton ATPase subunit C n=1 Tax=Bifiguratus adelaidae TaxID=1938954 RepID=A0A261XWB7_9FUNG|nr:hypothetical protein BZG36_04135 [Bifiguratus adelaidae]